MSNNHAEAMVDNQPRTLADFGELTAAERQVLDELDTGQDTVLGDGTLPDEDAGDDRRLRARFIRWVSLGCEGSEYRLHETGLQVEGALIVSDGPEGAETRGLDLEGCRLEHDLVLCECRFGDAPLLRAAGLRSLFLNGSALPGLWADELVAAGRVVLRDARVTGAVRVSGARIGGGLDCTGATLSNEGGDALSADRVRTEGTVFLRRAHISGAVRLLGARIGGNLDCGGAGLSNRDGDALLADGAMMEGGVFLSDACATGAVRLLGARIGGDLSCTGATLSNEVGNAFAADGVSTEGTVFLSGASVTGAVRLLGARIGGDLICTGATLSNRDRNALSADGARIEGGFLLRPDDQGRHTRIEGAVHLTAAEIGHINDHPDSWPETGSLVLNRCTYGAFTGRGVSAAERKEWLALQEPSRFNLEFWPQPYEQCAKVFREMGHPEDARAILIEKERRQRRALRRRAREGGGWRGRLRGAGRWLGDEFLGLTVAYGLKPLRAIRWLSLLWLLGIAGFWAAWNADQFKPNNPRVLRSAEWFGCAETAPPHGYLARVGESQLDCFLRQPEAQGYPVFNSIVYSLDVLAPVVELEQQKHWVPDEDQWGGWFAKGWLYVEIVMGWLLSLLAVAGLSGLIRSD